MKNKIYHNPKCSKSRSTLEILQSKDIDIEIIHYLETPPSIDELKEICALLKVKPVEIVRTKEDMYKELKLANKSLSDNDWHKILHANPKLLERPIVVYNNKAVIGRPPENVYAII